MNPPERAVELLDVLNPVQREAVSHPGGPLLVLAGAGSGKTRVITHRIAWLIRERGEAPGGIVAVTFTNKAAGEMRERTERLLGGSLAGAWIGTFHALCLRLLRRHGDRVGLREGFNVYDTDDQLAVVRRILKDDGVDDSAGSARVFLSRISRAKNAMETPEELAARSWSPDAKLHAAVYARYVEALRNANAADFDDLLLKALAMLRDEANEDLRLDYASRCRHLLVDEYQDTNRPQYLLVRALSSVHHAVFVVGDEDQSIYRFRGAEIRNILDFERDHPGARVIKLEQNYRSTRTILGAAGAVIANNRNRKGKTLWTENREGNRIALFRAPDDRAEAAWIAGRVRELMPGREPEHFAVLYRTNAQSRQMEEIFRRERIPYTLVGAVGFYERKEVKDLLAYLKLASNPADDVAFRRIVNVPPRGIGTGTLDVVEGLAARERLTLLEATRRVVAEGLIPSRAARMVQDFLALADEWIARAAEEPAAVVLDAILEKTGYEAWLEKANPGEGIDRSENVRALVSAAVEFEREDDSPGIRAFLDRSALVSDADEVGIRPGVTLMTVHNAKGLEFPVVFIAGLEEGLFPHARASDGGDDLEEERRLCYVAMTRARERLLLSHAASRLQQGIPKSNPPSRFLREIPEELLEEIRGAATGGFWDVRERPSGGSSAARAAIRTPASPVVVPSRAVAEKHDDGFDVGRTVTHPMFGSGRILDREGKGPSLKLTIQFVGHGTKRILPQYTRLDVV